MIKFIKYIFYFLLFFALFYSETMQVGSMTFSQVWKMPLVVFLLFDFFQKHKHHPSFIYPALFFAVIQILNSDLFASPFFAFSRAAKYADFPLLFAFIYSRARDSRTLWSITLMVAQFFVLCTIPYLLDIIPEKQNIEHVYGDTIGRLYIFQTMHAAAIILSFSIIVIAYKTKYYCRNFSDLFYNFVLLVIGLYAVFGTFVRTGWVMSLLGIVIIYFPRRFTMKEVVLGLVFITAIIIFFLFEYKYNVDFVNRIFDNNESRTIDQDSLGSGRLVFLKNGLTLFASSGFINWLFGCGCLSVFDYMGSHVGMNIGLHNGFADALVMNGIIGLLLLLSMLWREFKYIRKRRKSKYYLLLMAFYISYLSCMYTQGNIGFGQDLFAALLLGLIHLDYKERLGQSNNLDSHPLRRLSR